VGNGQDERLSCEDFVSIAGGTFVQADAHGHSRYVKTRPFAMQRTPVTAQQYITFLEDTGTSPPDRIETYDGEWRLGPKFLEANTAGSTLPAVGVSYHDALQFAAWAGDSLSARLRLPTEAEFEITVREGITIESPCVHPELVRRLRTHASLPAPRRAVGEDPNTLGVSDLLGCVWHWCSDWFGLLDDVAVDDPRGPADPPDVTTWRGVPHPAGRVIRGGSFSYPPEFAACTHRHFSKPTDRNFNLGFRLVLDPPGDVTGGH
jgi:formylglycine-generating enzyme required for sulfatase activity